MCDGIRHKKDHASVVFLCDKNGNTRGAPQAVRPELNSFYQAPIDLRMNGNESVQASMVNIKTKPSFVSLSMVFPSNKLRFANLCGLWAMGIAHEKINKLKPRRKINFSYITCNRL